MSLIKIAAAKWRSYAKQLKKKREPKAEESSQ